MSKAATSIVGRAEMVRAAAAMNGSTTPTRIPPRNLHGTNGGNGSGIGGPNWRTPPVGTMNPGFR